MLARVTAVLNSDYLPNPQPRPAGPTRGAAGRGFFRANYACRAGRALQPLQMLEAGSSAGSFKAK